MDAVVDSLFWGPADVYYYDILGIIGGFLLELMKWFPKREKMKTALSVIESLWLYWFVTVLMILAGGLLVHIYIKTGIKFNEYLAVNIGATAPLLLGLITEKAPNIRPSDSPS